MRPEIESAINEAATELGVDAVVLLDRIKDAVTRGIDPEHTAMFHMTEDDIVDVHSKISSALRMAGLKGKALDQAIAAAFTEAVRAIERERGMDQQRRATIREVQ
jgi:hypothetical protein